MINLAIVGVGKLANVCAQALTLQKEFKLVAACNHTRMRLQEFCQSYNLNGYLDIEEMVKNEQIQALLICSPVNTHYSYIKIGLNLNCNIICQAPFSLDYALLQDLHKLSRQTHTVITQIDYHYSEQYFNQLKKAIIQDNAQKLKLELYAQDLECCYLMLTTILKLVACNTIHKEQDAYYINVFNKKAEITLNKSTEGNYFKFKAENYYFNDVLETFADIHNPSQANLSIFNQKEFNIVINSYSLLLSDQAKLIQAQANSNDEFTLSLKVLKLINDLNIFE